MKSARSGSWWSGSETNRTFPKTGGGRFADASYISGFGFDDEGRALAVTDWDGDGHLDLWASLSSLHATWPDGVEGSWRASATIAG